MKNSIIYFLIFHVFLSLSSCSKDDYLQPYFFNIDIETSSVINNNWSNNSLKTIKVNLDQIRETNSNVIVSRYINDSAFNNFVGDLEFNLINNQIEITINPLTHIGYYSFVVEIIINDIKRYVAIQSNINTENKEFIYLWRSTTRNSANEISKNYNGNTFKSYLFCNISGDILNLSDVVIKSIINNTGTLKQYSSFTSTAPYPWIHSEIN